MEPTQKTHDILTYNAIVLLYYYLPSLAASWRTPPITSNYCTPPGTIVLCSMITIRRNVQRHNDRARSRRSMRAAVPVVVVARGDGAAEQVGRLAVRVHQQLRALSDWACVLPGAVRLPQFGSSFPSPSNMRWYNTCQFPRWSTHMNLPIHIEVQTTKQQSHACQI